MRLREKTRPLVKTYIVKHKLADGQTRFQVTMVSSVDRVSRTRRTRPHALVAAREGMGIRPRDGE